MPVRAVHHQPLCADFNGNQLSDNVSYRMWLMRSGRPFEDERALELIQKAGHVGFVLERRKRSIPLRRAPLDVQKTGASPRRTPA